MTVLPPAPRSDIVELLEQLVAFDTTSRNSNLALINMAAELLSGVGAKTRLTWNDSRTKANLFATLGPDDRPGIVLSGHSDVVPVDGQDWSSDPFRLDRRDGRLYGRGTADMKGFLAAALAFAPDFAARPLAMPVHFALSYDEEIGCIGVRRMLDDLAELEVQPRLCIVGEPTEMTLVNGHKGKKSVRCQVLGHECHSALNHQGVNAVEIAAEIVARLRAMQRRLRETGPFEVGYHPPYTTVHTGVIKGGTALNIVPGECCFEFEIRNLPRHDPELLMAEIRSWAQELIPEMLAVSDHAGIILNENNTTAGLDMDPADPAVRLALSLAGGIDTAFLAYTTEAGLFQKSGIPAVVCGPGNIEQAHKADEFVSLEQLAHCESFLGRLLDYVTTPESGRF
ncbi:acetylornithine deacetylase [Magnetospirillum molischianum]|uniref:Acetylornithine deacetylase/Succinyl-diaminopimelate desuccinylase and related deacylase n=1 Tax=Magnetospirillum molischianum DSM 120 TaxID=1150626 RepID=H8FXD5_MAGML|nr:acetylornithine deacetylase [Magnetospirillum molischianum]CCG43023.1 Acetylornithine deacetylase/Succinyl-diaminopimelate desuccinylase and related deacylase [Magnetospirillum molischianum DSM 120]